MGGAVSGGGTGGAVSRGTATPEPAMPSTCLRSLLTLLLLLRGMRARLQAEPRARESVWRHQARGSLDRAIGLKHTQHRAQPLAFGRASQLAASIPSAAALVAELPSRRPLPLFHCTRQLQLCVGVQCRVHKCSRRKDSARINSKGPAGDAQRAREAPGAAAGGRKTTEGSGCRPAGLPGGRGRG